MPRDIFSLVPQSCQKHNHDKTSAAPDFMPIVAIKYNMHIYHKAMMTCANWKCQVIWRAYTRMHFQPLEALSHTSSQNQSTGIHENHKCYQSTTKAIMCHFPTPWKIWVHSAINHASPSPLPARDWVPNAINSVSLQRHQLCEPPAPSIMWASNAINYLSLQRHQLCEPPTLSINISIMRASHASWVI